ncbi:MAG: MaoC family dehydratase N-terminal domain-containing protein [Nocardioidaceae bacterium]|nr:MaoC family dehydratase N-terminal domain-containing protein [Nocardioidaceae bacterium]
MGSLARGDQLPTQTYRVTRADLIAYAGASDDHNPIHWSDRVAASVGLPGVIAHGMFTMALGGRALSTWAGDAGRVRDYGVRFTRPVVVPDDDEGVEVVVEGVVDEIVDGAVRVDLTVRCGAVTVLGRARASVSTDA